MNTKKFGVFVLVAGIIAAAVAGYFYRTVNNEKFLSEMREYRSWSAAGSSGGWRYGEYAAMQGAAENKAMIFGGIGGLLVLLGIGLMVSSKDTPGENESSE